MVQALQLHLEVQALQEHAGRHHQAHAGAVQVVVQMVDAVVATMKAQKKAIQQKVAATDQCL
jgi:hypothetical protein